MHLYETWHDLGLAWDQKNVCFDSFLAWFYIRKRFETESTLSYSSEYPSRTTYTLSWWSLVSNLESFGAVRRRMQYELTAVRYCAMCHWHRSDVFIVNFKHISYLFLMFLLLDFEQVKYLQGTYSGLISA